MSTTPNEAKFSIDWEKELPDWTFFPVHYLAKEWHCSPEHISNLIETGQLPIGVDLRGRNSSKAMLRIPRTSLLTFLNRRKDLETIAAANPRPKTREERRRGGRKGER